MCPFVMQNTTFCVAKAMLLGGEKTPEGLIFELDVLVLFIMFVWIFI